MLIDLAGSERSADSKGHDKARMEVALTPTPLTYPHPSLTLTPHPSPRLQETKLVNSSLMALKDCIRARTQASSTPAGQKTFVPYRRTKLTLLMKVPFPHLLTGAGGFPRTVAALGAQRS